MVNQASPNYEKMKENCRIHRKGVDKDEYQKIRIQHSNDVDEVNVWGRRYTMNRQEAHESMWDAFLSVQQFRIPRTVAERLDLSSNAKLVYGVLLNFPHGVTLYRWELGGFCGLSAYSVSLAVGDLERAGLLKVYQQWRDTAHRHRAPDKMIPIQPPNRFIKKEPLTFLANDISNFEEMIHARFDET